jgi:hypothetical protein
VVTVQAADHMQVADRAVGCHAATHAQGCAHATRQRPAAALSSMKAFGRQLLNVLTQPMHMRSGCQPGQCPRWPHHQRLYSCADAAVTCCMALYTVASKSCKLCRRRSTHDVAATPDMPPGGPAAVLAATHSCHQLRHGCSLKAWRRHQAIRCYSTTQGTPLYSPNNAAARVHVGRQHTTRRTSRPCHLLEVTSWLSTHSEVEAVHLPTPCALSGTLPCRHVYIHAPGVALGTRRLSPPYIRSGWSRIMHPHRRPRAGHGQQRGASPSHHGRAGSAASSRQGGAAAAAWPPASSLCLRGPVSKPPCCWSLPGSGARMRILGGCLPQPCSDLACLSAGWLAAWRTPCGGDQCLGKQPMLQGGTRRQCDGHQHCSSPPPPATGQGRYTALPLSAASASGSCFDKKHTHLDWRRPPHLLHWPWGQTHRIAGPRTRCTQLACWGGGPRKGVYSSIMTHQQHTTHSNWHRQPCIHARTPTHAHTQRRAPARQQSATPAQRCTTAAQRGAVQDTGWSMLVQAGRMRDASLVALFVCCTGQLGVAGGGCTC